MPYIKYYRLETVNGKPLLESTDIAILRTERDNQATNIPENGKIYSYDLDEENPVASQRLINRVFVE